PNRCSATTAGGRVAVTDCVRAVAVLGAKAGSPLYEAPIACVPAASGRLRLAVATPPDDARATRGCARRSRVKVAVPVGVTPEVPAAGVPVAVKVPDCPAVEGFADDASAVVVAAPTGAGRTVCVTGDDWLGPKVASPP